MARLAMESVGVDDEEIDRTEDLYRARDRERLTSRSRPATSRGARPDHHRARAAGDA